MFSRRGESCLMNFMQKIKSFGNRESSSPNILRKKSLQKIFNIESKVK